jgi:hypothetical protein
MRLEVDRIESELEQQLAFGGVPLEDDDPPTNLRSLQENG